MSETIEAGTSPAKPRRRRYANVGASALAVVEAARRGLDPARVIATLATALEREGCAEEAATLRTPPKTTRSFHTFGGGPGAKASETVRWFAPEDPIDAPVFTGSTGHALEELLADLHLASSFIAAGVDAPTRALFAGPTGTGKTLAARWIARELGLPIAIVQIDRVVDSHMGETARQIGKALEETDLLPSVLFLDEVDGLCARREHGATAADAELGRVTTALLQRLDQIAPGRIVIAATNLPERLDGALLRRLPARIDFDLPDRGARAQMIAQWTAKAGLLHAVTAWIVETSEGLSGADLRARVMQVARDELRVRWARERGEG